MSLRPSVVAAYVSALLVCAIGWLAYGSTHKSAAAVNRSRDAVRTTAAVRALDDALQDANVAERDLVTTGDPAYSGAYDAASNRTIRSLGALRDIAAPFSLDTRLDSLGYFVRLRLAELDETVRAQRVATGRVRTAPGAAAFTSARGTQADRRIGDLLDSVDSTVDRSISRSSAFAVSDGNILLLVIMAMSAVAILLAFFVNYAHSQNVRTQRRMMEEMENQSLQLQLQAAELTTTNHELEQATSEMLRQTVEAERSEARLAGILGSATDAVVSFGDDERLVYSNAAARRLFALEDADTPEPRILAAVASRSIPAFEEHMLAARRSARIGVASPEVWDTLVVRPDGEEVPVEVSMAYTRSGKEGLFTAVLRDVSKQRQLEEEFRQAQKMEAVGRLAGGIAHDFNNLLTVIGASSDFLLHDLRGQPTSLSADVREIKAATNRAASLTRQLLAFSRRQLVQTQHLDLNAVVREMETMLRRLIGEDAILTTEYADDIGMVTLDRGQLEQIVVNLVVNARDAMPGGGTIRLCTAREIVNEDGMHSDYVTLAVADAGVGMDEATRERIFEPFFTTKEQGKGTGLGLSTVYGIVTGCGGDIVVESEVGSGTEFRLRFPHAEPEPLAVQTEPVDSVSAGGSETILLVEDEEPLRRLTRRILESRGYVVLDAANGAEAIQVLASAHAKVDLLLTDVVMPGMSGRELVERLLPVYPWLRVLFMSGYTEDMMLQHRISELGIAVVQKPFTRDDVALAVRHALDWVAEPA